MLKDRDLNISRVDGVFVTLIKWHEVWSYRNTFSHRMNNIQSSYASNFSKSKPQRHKLVFHRKFLRGIDIPEEKVYSCIDIFVPKKIKAVRGSHILPD